MIANLRTQRMIAFFCISLAIAKYNIVRKSYLLGKDIMVGDLATSYNNMTSVVTNQTEQTTNTNSTTTMAITSTYQMHSSFDTSWTSPYQVDCKQKLYDGNNDTVFKLINITKHLYLMNIYDPTTDGVSKEIHEKGCWECHHLQDMLKALSSYPDAYFLDIGGNLGMWSLTTASANYETFIIEALSANIDKLCHSINRNSFHNIHLLHVAANDVPDQTFSLRVPQGNVGGTRVTLERGTDGVGLVKGVMIDSLKLPVDRPVVIKLDVEGHELNALLGAHNFLTKANIVYFMMELRPNLHKTHNWKVIFDLLTSKGLKPYRINYEDETELDVNRLDQWVHFKHPIIRYYDVVWRKESFNTSMWS